MRPTKSGIPLYHDGAYFSIRREVRHGHRVRNIVKVKPYSRIDNTSAYGLLMQNNTTPTPNAQNPCGNKHFSGVGLLTTSTPHPPYTHPRATISREGQGWMWGGSHDETHPCEIPIYKGISNDWGGCRVIFSNNLMN